MLTKAMISDKDDIIQKSFTNGSTGEVRVSGEIHLLTTKPTQVVTVKVSPELWEEAQNGKFFESLVGQQHEFMLAPKDFSFVRDGQQVSGTNINLFQLPQVQGK